MTDIRKRDEGYVSFNSGGSDSHSSFEMKMQWIKKFDEYVD